MKVSEFEYYIAARNSGSGEWEIIAMFLNESDRDYALGALEEAHPDCEFKREGEE